MDTVKIAITIMLASVSLVLTPWVSGFAIPSFVPVLWFQFWEIPVFVALFLIGLKSAVFISFIDAAQTAAADRKVMIDMMNKEMAKRELEDHFDSSTLHRR